MRVKSLLVILVCILSLICLTPIAGAQATSMDNPIDQHFSKMFNEASSTVEQRMLSSTYLDAWQKELEHVAGANAKAELAAIEPKAIKAGEREFAKWGGGTGGPGASVLAQSRVYKARALELISKQGSEYQYSFHTARQEDSYMPLVLAMANSQIFHYDAFTTQADAFTINMTLYQMVIKQQQFVGKDFLLPIDGVYAFRYGNEDCTAEKVSTKQQDISPDSLYEDIFASGKYLFPDAKGFPPIVMGTQTGIIISDLALSSSANLRFLAGWQNDDTLTLRYLLGKTDNTTKQVEWLGIADIVLQKAAEATCGYKIAAYKPTYNIFANAAEIMLEP